jgi:sigma-B regulation protein RsbU (phosphoserine phosphatase)
LLALLGVFVVVVGTMTTIGLVLTIVRDDRRAVGSRLLVARERVAQLTTAYLDQETGQRGYVLTGDPDFLDPYVRGTAQARRLSRDLEQLIDGDDRARLARVESLARRWRDDAAEPAIRARQEGQPLMATALAPLGKTRFDALRASADELQRAVDASAEESSTVTGRLRSGITVLLIGVLAVTLGGLVIAAALLRTWVTTPVRVIGDGLRRVRGGALDEPIPAIGPPELAGLGHDADEMRLRLSHAAHDAERARESIEQNAEVILTLRAELRPDPGELPEGWSVAAEIRPAHGLVAGDCADVVRVDDGHVGLLVVDISGHGAVAGILALRCKELLRSGLAFGSDPGTALASTAEQLGPLGDETFLSALVVVVDVREGSLRFANAGHPPALVCGADGTRELAPTGPIIGIGEDGWRTATETLRPGENLVVYTDGIIEARRDGDLFGSVRLAELAARTDCAEAETVVATCLDEVEAFAPGRLQDDATIVVLCRPLATAGDLS